MFDSCSLVEVEDSLEYSNKVGMVDYNIHSDCIEHVLNLMKEFRRVPNQEFAVHTLTGIRTIVLSGFSFRD